MTKYENLLEHENENAACKQKSKSASSACNYDTRTVKHFYCIKAYLLKSFVTVRIIEDLQKLNENNVPTLKGKINDVDKVKPPVLLEVACKLRNNCFIARTPLPLVIENNT